MFLKSFLLQGLQRRATPHPSELKEMKKVIEERRNEGYTSRPDGEEESPDLQVNTSTCLGILGLISFFFLHAAAKALRAMCSE